MSFGQGGPQWGGGGPQNENPYGRQDPASPYGRQPEPQPPLQTPPQSGTPDWGALADASAARGRRKLWLMLGGGVLATAAVAAIVATAVVSAGNGGSDTAASASPGVTGTGAGAPAQSIPVPQPSFSSVAPAPPLNPKSFLDSAAKDKAPLSAGSLYPGRKLTIGGREYAKGATSTTSCAAGSQGVLGGVLNAQGCRTMYRATYTRDGVAVTVAVATFDTEARAKAAEKAADGDGIASLPGSGVPVFCRAPAICLKTVNSYARYGYFTVAGFEDRHNVTEQDKGVFTADHDVSQFAFDQIVARGVAQASAAASPGS